MLKGMFKWFVGLIKYICYGNPQGLKELKNRIRIKYPFGEEVKSMCQFEGTLFVATESRIYKLKDDKLEPIEIIVEENPEQILAGFGVGVGGFSVEIEKWK